MNNKITQNRWHGKPVHSHYSRLEELLSKDNIFHKPVNEDGTWPYPTQYEALESLDYDNKQKMISDFLSSLDKIESKMKSLEKADDNHYALEDYLLLSQAATFLKEKDLYVIDGKLQLINWGKSIIQGDIKDSKSIFSIRSYLTELKNRTETTIEMSDGPDWKMVALGVGLFLSLLTIGLLLYLMKFAGTVTSKEPHTEISDSDKYYQEDLANSRNRLSPIDTAHIIYNTEDSLELVQILDDQVNIFFDEGDDIDEISKTLLLKFPDIEVIGRDVNYQQISLKVNPKSRETIKMNLKSEYPDALVVDEAIFNQKYINDPGFKDKTKAWYLNAIGIEKAWQVEKGDSSITIAVIDNAFDLNHPELKNKIVRPWNVWENSDKVYAESWNDHGTHVAATAAGELDNKQGLSGVAPGCSIMPIQVGDKFGNISLSAMLKGIMYAYLNGADVINLSLGTISLRDPSLIPIARQKEISKTTLLDEEKLWSDTFKKSKKYNCIIVQAAGNSSCLAELDPMKRDSKNSIIVAASKPNGALAEFSCFGEVCQIKAPGTGIYNAVPDNGYEFMDGTSMASPIVAGVVALLKSENVDITTEQALKSLLDAATPSKELGGQLLSVEKLFSVKKGSSKLQELQKTIEDLKNQLKASYLSVLPNNKNNEYFNEIWISDREMIDPITGKSVKIFYDIDANLQGKVSFFSIDASNECKGKVSLKFDKETLLIEQSVLSCEDGKIISNQTILCKNDKYDIANCYFIDSDGNQGISSFKLRKL